ncbi:hypothetical protein E1B28_000050 [Marasmius oreades]|uniref:JmjC domain-containing protein n=1 Tax=Marasmius oreades TaxID=181124 RepID=A0A9P7V0G7_9AGAR|nr:uncharacterized protein E1B28_000050 [Marasmius oreades]KAG7098076.1 hypothetical protein E1B28_000050 [Marasmius oreades]
MSIQPVFPDQIYHQELSCIVDQVQWTGILYNGFIPVRKSTYSPVNHTEESGLPGFAKHNHQWFYSQREEVVLAGFRWNHFILSKTPARTYSSFEHALLSIQPLNIECQIEVQQPSRYQKQYVQGNLTMFLDKPVPMKATLSISNMVGRFFPEPLDSASYNWRAGFSIGQQHLHGFQNVQQKLHLEEVTSRNYFSTLSRARYGYAISISVVYGCKVVFVFDAWGAQRTKHHSHWAFGKWLRDMIRGKNVQNRVRHSTIFPVVLKPGDVLILHPGTPYMELTLEDTVSFKDFFYCSSTIRESCFSILIDFIRDPSETSAFQYEEGWLYYFQSQTTDIEAVIKRNKPYIRDLFFMLAGWHTNTATASYTTRCLESEEDPHIHGEMMHTPNLLSITGILDFIALLNVFRLSSSTWPESYRWRMSMEQSQVDAEPSQLVGLGCKIGEDIWNWISNLPITAKLSTSEVAWPDLVWHLHMNWLQCQILTVAKELRGNSLIVHYPHEMEGGKTEEGEVQVGEWFSFCIAEVLPFYGDSEWIVELLSRLQTRKPGVEDAPYTPEDGFALEYSDISSLNWRYEVFMTKNVRLVFREDSDNKVLTSANTMTLVSRDKDFIRIRRSVRDWVEEMKHSFNLPSEIADAYNQQQ